MAKIFYSMAGEGRGHATRVRCMVERLRDRHELILFAPDQAFELLAPRYAQDPRVEVVRIPGLRFYYRNNRLNLRKSIWSGLGYLSRLSSIRRQLEERIRSDQPDLAIADFEGALPRAARRCGLPLISLDHQQFLVACDLSWIPRKLGFYAALMKPVVKAHCWGQRLTIISSFFKAPVLPRWQQAVLVGPLLRPEVAKAVPTTGDYILSYLRQHTPSAVLEALRQSGRPVRVYGLGDRPSEGPFTYRPFDEQGFIDDLAGCAGLIGAAGNQTLGEALCLGKPVLALPEKAHFEQMINAFFLRHMGAGDWVTAEEAGLPHVESFLANLEQYRRQLEQDKPVDGGPQAAQLIEEVLQISRHALASGSVTGRRPGQTVGDRPAADARRSD